MRAGMRIGTAVASAAIACTAALSVGSTAASASTIHTTVTRSAGIQPYLATGWYLWQTFNNTPLQLVICNLKGQLLVETHQAGISAYACTPAGDFLYLYVFIP
jgi:hypothetical protein